MKAHFLALSLVLVAGCVPHDAIRAPVSPAPSAARASAAGSGLRYEVTAGPGARELVVAADFPVGVPEELSVDDGAEPFVREVTVDSGQGERSVSPRGTSWMAPECTARGCRVRYRFFLRDAARSMRDVDTAQARGETYEAPPSTWLLRPLRARSGTPYRFHVTTPPGILFVTGVWTAPDGQADAYAADVENLPYAPYSAFGPLRVRTLEAQHVVVAIAPGKMASDDDALMGWVSANALAVERFYGRFPVPRLLVIVSASGGDEVDGGKTMGNGGASIVVSVGREAGAHALADDWVLPHEMIHTALPSIELNHHWLEEGLASYVEPFARARAGTMTPERLWRELVLGLPQGLPQEGDEGLDHTPTWGRTYWGGALFCFLADLDIRARTHGQRSLDDALRGILAAGGNIGQTWGLERVLRVGDEATGVPALRELHAKMGDAPSPVDLDAIWKRLGVVMKDRAVTFDDTAPLAGMRRAMTAPRTE